MELGQFKEVLSKNIFGMSRSEAREQGLCVDCKEPALPKCHSAAGREEYRISGLCEVCFDRIFEEE